MRQDVNKIDMDWAKQKMPVASRIVEILHADSVEDIKNRISQLGTTAVACFGTLGVGLIAHGDVVAGVGVSVAGMFTGGSSALMVRKLDRMQDEYSGLSDEQS